MVWAPSVKPVNVLGEVQAAYVPESTVHSKVPPASPVKLIEPEVLFPLDGEEVIVGASGELTSTVIVNVDEVAEVFPPKV
jgi:hypothetical protein